VASVHDVRRQDPDGNGCLGVRRAGPAICRCTLDGHPKRILAHMVGFPSCGLEKTRSAFDLQRGYGAPPG
jgi:hypothetical protein